MRKKNSKDFTFYKYICQIYILADINETVENQDLYSNKDDLKERKNKQNIFNF